MPAVLHLGTDKFGRLSGKRFHLAGPDGSADLLDLVSAIAFGRWTIDTLPSPCRPGPYLAELVGDSGRPTSGALQSLRDAIGNPAPPGLPRTARFEPGQPHRVDAYRVVVTALTP